MRKKRERRKDKVKPAVTVTIDEPSLVWAVTYKKGNSLKKSYVTGESAADAGQKIIRSLGRNGTATIIKSVPVKVDKRGQIKEVCLK